VDHDVHAVCASEGGDLFTNLKNQKKKKKKNRLLAYKSRRKLSIHFSPFRIQRHPKRHLSKYDG
jgi:hypothetical protein